MIQKYVFSVLLNQIITKNSKIMITLIVVLIIVVIGILSKLIHNRIQREIYHRVIVNNLFMEKFLQSDDYLAIAYTKRSGLQGFQVIPVEQFTSKKSIRKYFRSQSSNLKNLKNCFRSPCAVSKFKENPNIGFLMDLERTCLNSRFCALCPSRFQCNPN